MTLDPDKQTPIRRCAHGVALGLPCVECTTNRMPVTMRDGVEYSAYLSADGVYRYVLQRAWANTRPLVFIGLNPSTADGLQDDPTIRVCMGLARRWGFTGIVMVNAFAFRATDPAEMLNRSKAIAIGPENEHWLVQASYYRDSLFVACWGNHCPDWRAREVAQLFPAERLCCVGRNKNGSPKHPLRVRVDGLELWQPVSEIPA